MNKYKAVWIMTDGSRVEETFSADGYQILPNGIAVLFKERNVQQIRLVNNKEEQQLEMIGSIAGFNYIVQA